MKKMINNSWPELEVLNCYVPLCLFLGALLIIALSGCGPNASTPDPAQEAAERELREVAATAATVLNVYMDGRVTEMLLAAKWDGPLKEVLGASPTQAAANSVLEEWRNVSGGYEAILLLDKNGVAVASAPALLLNGDFSKEDVFRAAVEGKVAISDLHKSDVLVSLAPKRKGEVDPAAGWTVAIGVSIAFQNNERGVLLGFLDWSAVARLTAGMVIGKTGFVYVLNNQNRVIVHPYTPMYGTALSDPKINLPVLDDAIRRRANNCRHEFVSPVVGMVGIKMVGFAYPKGYGNFPEQGWTVAACANESEIAGIHPIWKWLLR